MKRTCKQCGKEFFISQSEINFYKSRNLQIPRRCKECREANRQQPAQKKESRKENNETAPITVNTEAAEVVKTEEAVQEAPYSAETRQEQPAGKMNGETGRKKTGPVTKLLTVAAIALILIVSQMIPRSSGSLPQAEASGKAYVDSGLTFRNEEYLNDHYQKHGIEMGFSSPEEYQTAAAAVVGNGDALHKTEAEDGDDVYYIESTNEFVIVSTDGYIRTYFYPEDGIDYFNRQ